MPTRDPRIDAYIAKSPSFAQPILEHIRETVHAACPEVQETIKWGMPFFDYHGVMCAMAAFKQHCSMRFWKGAHIPGLPADNENGEAMGNFGRITKIADLPSKKVLTGYIKAAMKLNEEGTPVAKPKRVAKPEAVVPPDLAAALAKNRKAKAAFAAFPPGHRREYVEWVTEAKREETRQKRIAQTVEWVSEGKSRNWKY